MKNTLYFVIVIICGYYFYTNYVNPQYPTTQNTTSQKKNEVKIEETNCSRNGDYVDVKGYVKNLGNLDYYYVEVKISLKNENGEVLDTYNTYAVGGEGIAPNERKSFDAMLYHAEGTTGCSYSVVGYDN